MSALQRSRRIQVVDHVPDDRRYFDGATWVKVQPATARWYDPADVHLGDPELAAALLVLMRAFGHDQVKVRVEKAR